MTARRIPMIEIHGSHYQMGCQYGEACRDQIAHSIESARQLLADAYSNLQLTWESAAIQARKYLPFAEERFPRYVEEMKGIADGSGLDFNAVAVVNVMEAVTMDALHLTKCTSIALAQERTTNGHVLIAHNEDWVPEDEPDLVILRARPADGPSFLAMTYGALLPNIGLNADGIAQCCDSVYPCDSRIGTPRVIASRAILSATTPGEAIRCTLSPQRAAGYNHLIAHESGELYNVEVSARRFAVLPSENGCIVHTNHYLNANMQEIECDPDELVATRVRYFRAQRLLGLIQCHDLASLQSIQRDHVNYQDSICNHAVNEISSRWTVRKPSPPC